jgi:hypothetical protein
MSTVFVTLLLFHLVLIAAVVLFNCIESLPVTRQPAPDDDGGGLGYAAVFIALGVFAITAEAWLRRARRKRQEEHLRQLRMRARLASPPEPPLVSG